MSEYYTSQRVKGLYDPTSSEPFKLSRSKIDLSLDCPRCFYYDRKLGVGRPPGFPFALNSAVDHLLKAEFDIHRANGTKHPLIEKYGVDARPIPHEQLEKWRHNFWCSVRLTISGKVRRVNTSSSTTRRLPKLRISPSLIKNGRTGINVRWRYISGCFAEKDT